jgi:hypothetical protein
VTRRRPAGAGVRLLLDEMHTPTAAEMLRSRGHDLLCAQDAGLRNIDDGDVLAAATAAGRAVVTENVKDYVPILQQWAAAGRDHAGLIFTDPRRFNRAARSYPGDLIAALDAFCRACPVTGSSWVWWL